MGAELPAGARRDPAPRRRARGHARAAAGARSSGCSISGTGDGNTLALGTRGAPGREWCRPRFPGGDAATRLANASKVTSGSRSAGTTWTNRCRTDLGSFDVVVSSFAIHHLVPERQRALYGEVFDRLRPGGLFANVEHVASRSDRLHIAFLAAIGRTPASRTTLRTSSSPSRRTCSGSMTWAFGTSSATGSGASWPRRRLPSRVARPPRPCVHTRRGEHTWGGRRFHVKVRRATGM